MPKLTAKTIVEKLANKIGVTPTMPDGKTVNVAAAPIGNGGFAVVAQNTPKRDKRTIGDLRGYTRMFFDAARSTGAAPEKCALPNAPTVTGFAGGGWQFVCQLAQRLNGVEAPRATAWGVYAAAPTGTLALVGVGIADNPALAKVQARVYANKYLGSEFKIPSADTNGASQLPTVDVDA